MKKEMVWIGGLTNLVFLSAMGWAATGVASLKGTAPDSTLSGTVLLTDTKAGLKVSADITNAPAGLHGFHIHDFGSCDDSGKAAGGHYNPMNHTHGNTLQNPKKAHAGDMGNIEIGADGTGKLEAILPKLALTSGKHTVGGRAIIFHEKADDFGQPTGNAGGRIGCGPIVITGQ